MQFNHYSNGRRMLLKLALGILPILGSQVHAQMNNSNGAFTINSANAASSTNFRDWRSFSQALQNVTRNDAGPLFGGAGISTPIVVNVQSSLTESVPVLFPQITGSSLTNSITINGDGNFVAFANTSTSASKAVISFTGGDFFRIRNLTIRNTGNAAPWGIWFSNQSNNNLIENCIIEFSAWTGLVTGHGSTATAFINFSASELGTNQTSSVHPGQFDTIRACTLRTTNTNSPGPTFGINILGSTSVASSTPSNNTFDRNLIQNFYVNGIMNWYTNGDRIINNDISRVNAGTTLPLNVHMGIRAEYMYGQGTNSRSFQINNNLIHDLPYNGSSATAGAATPYGIYTLYCYGASVSNQSEIDGNSIFNLRSTTFHYGFFGLYNYRMRITNNTIRNCESGSTSYSWSMYAYYHFDCNVDNNIIRANRPNSNYRGIHYGYSNGGTCNGNLITDNVSTSTTSTYYYHYDLDIQYPTNSLIARNQIIANGCANLSYLYSINHFYPTNTQLESNLIAKQLNYFYHYALYAYNFSNGGNNTIDNNTIDINYNSPYSTTYHLTMYIGGYSTTGPWKIRGNIVTQTSPNDFYNYMCYLFGQTTGFAEFDYNVFFCANTRTNLYFSGVGAGFIGTWPGIITNASNNLNTGFAPIGATRNNIFVNPRFANIAANDYRPTGWRCNNSMPTVTGRDVTNAVRNPITSDRGCRENFTDLQATSVTWNAGTSPCSNFSERPSITIRNTFSDTAYNFNVSFRVNNGPKVTERFTGRILSGQSGSHTFQAPVRLIPGNVRLQVFIDIPDDNRANDTQIFNMNVRPAPSGGEFTLVEGLNDPRKNMEVTIENQSVRYNFSPPRLYTNSQYGASNRWTATPFARSIGGRNVSSYVSLSNTPGATNGEITFTPTSLSDEDSTFIVGVVVRDVVNGCDTTIQRRVFVQPLGRPAFNIPSVNCLGDATFFENNSTVKSGALDYIWYFGDGDTSIASSPVHTYATTGTYNVRLVTVTNPYGFTNEITIPLTINDVPAVNFSKVNVCDGGLVRFTNTTAPLTPTTYSWDLGDGTKPTATNPSHTYSRVGSYQVTLTATLNGCAKSITKNMYVFPKPVASYTKVNGNCENELITFQNRSTISSGLLGYYWDFDDNGAVGTLQDESHDFSTPGIHRVKMKAISEFGCADSATQNINIRPAPAAGFTNTAACSITPTTFTNTTAPVAGTTPTYTWNFGDGTNSGVMSPVKNWTTLGPKTVNLKVALDNGCSDEISRTLSVGIQPSANFSASNVCAGEQMVFVNNTTWPQGDITYLWNFADGNTSSQTAPRYTYTGVTSTRVFNVTLYAFIAGGCADSMTKQVIVNEGPRTCDFDADLNYNKGFRGVDFTPKSGTGSGAQPGVNYTWIYDTEGQSNGPAGYNNFQEDGVYRITMRARNANGCECIAVKTVTINRRGISEASGLDAMVNLYPNPNNGLFTVSVSDAVKGNDLRIGLYDILGSQIAEVPTAGRANGNFAIDGSKLSSGVYLVKVSAGGQQTVLRVNIQR